MEWLASESDMSSSADSRRDAAPVRRKSVYARGPEPDDAQPFCPAMPPGTTSGRSKDSAKMIAGATPGRSGSVPHATSSRSEMPSPSVSERTGLVP